MVSPARRRPSQVRGRLVAVIGRPFANVSHAFHELVALIVMRDISVVLLAVPALAGMRLWKVMRDPLIELWRVFSTNRQLGRTDWKANVAE